MTVRRWLAPSVSGAPVSRLFFVVELVCAAGFIAFMAEGRTSLALAFLVGPLQLLAWAVLMRDDIPILLYFAFLFPLVPLAFVPHPFGRYVLYPGTILMLVVSRAAWLRGETRGARSGLTRWERTPAQALLVCFLVSFVLATARGLGNRHLLIQNVLLLETFVLAYFYATTPKSARDVRKLLLASGAAVVLVSGALPALAASSGMDMFMGGKVRVGPFGIFDLNTLGGIVAIFMSVLLCIVLDTRRLAVRLILAFALLLLLAALVASRSRGAWLGFGVALLYVLVRKRSLGMTLIVAGAAALFLVSDVLRQTVLIRLGQTSIQDASLAGRASLWYYALRMFRDNWFTGVGWENFRVLKVHYGFPAASFGQAEMMRYNTHNVYLETLVDVGILGLASFLWLLAGAFLRTDKLARNGRCVNAGLAVALNAGLVAFGVHGLWDCLTAMFMIPAALLGLATCLWRLEPGRSQT